VQELEVHAAWWIRGRRRKLAGPQHHAPLSDARCFRVPVCAVLLRFCTAGAKRRRPEKIPMAQVESAFATRGASGDPHVIMSAAIPCSCRTALDEICKRLRRFPIWRCLRIGAGSPAPPERVTPELCESSRSTSALHQYALQPPPRADPAAVQALGYARRRKGSAGLPDRALKGVNGDPGS